MTRAIFADFHAKFSHKHAVEKKFTKILLIMNEGNEPFYLLLK